MDQSNRSHRRTFALALLLCWSIPAARTIAQDKPIAFVGAHVIPVVGNEFDDGVVIASGGKIVAIARADAVQIPADVERIDVTGKTIMPGIIDTHTHIGGPSGADGSAPIQPECRAIDSINVRDAGIQKAQAGGITTVNIMPGSGHLLSGQTVYLKLRDGNTIDDLTIPDPDKIGGIAGGMKMANGTNSIRNAPFPGTRAKSAALDREYFIRAIEYREKVRKAAADKTDPPPRDLGLEAMGEVLDRKRVVHFHTHRYDDILSVLRLQKEFGFRVVLHHVSEGWKIPDEIARSGAPCSVIVLDSPGGKPEAQDVRFETCAALDKAGVLVAIHTDDYITDSRLLLRSAGLAMRGGLSRESALRALTINGAKILDLDSRIGSLEVGKDADLVVLSGEPLSVYTNVLQTYVEGKKVFDRNDPKDHLFAVGGYGASKDQVEHVDCFNDGDSGGQN